MDFNEKFMEIRVSMKEKERLEALKVRTENRQKELLEKKRELQEQLKKEEKDVEKLEGMSLTHFIHMIKGDVDDVLYKEQQEAISAKLKYDGIASEIEFVSREVQDVDKKINTLVNLEEQYMALIREKEEYIKNNPASSKDELDGIIEREAEVQRAKKELQEALYAGKELSYALQSVEESLDSAESWGIYDMVGGGLIATAAKHSRLDEASSRINKVQSLLTKFHSELSDLGEYLHISIDIGSFLGFADYFFDGFFADWTVQSRINDAQGRVHEAIYKVNSLMGQLENELNGADMEFERLEKKRMEVIERA